MAYSYSCGCLFNNVNLNVRYIIMSYNRNKFEHNLKKAKRQRKNERSLLEQKFFKTFNPFNTSNLKNNE
mgnify:CR=1 FL=1